MHEFAKLLDKLFYTYGNLAKISLLKNYFANTADPERGYALAIMAGELSFPFFKSANIRQVIEARVDPVLVGLSFDYVGDLSETVALLWPSKQAGSEQTLPTLADFIAKISQLKKDAVIVYISELLDIASPAERWALLKLGTGNLRIGVSARFLKQALADYGNVNVDEIEQIWHGLTPPYTALFHWLEGKAEKPNVTDQIYFRPVMLANPLADEDLLKITPDLYALERKYDGIRVQIIVTSNEKALFSRSGDDISNSFPDVLDALHAPVVLDGELVVVRGTQIGSFNDLQQRLNRKTATKKMLAESPAHVILYDILETNTTDVKALTFLERRKILEAWLQECHPINMSLSELLDYHSVDNLRDIRAAIIDEKNIAVEGLMIKRKDSAYLAGRPVGHWYKWKRDPLLVDAVLMYAQRGHGKRSSYYSDYTFGLWQEDVLLPIGKAYSGFTDAELYQLDKWIRHHTINNYGPVREVEKKLVFEVAFDAVNFSARHKSGVALRFPRIHRIRWDKPAGEADVLENLRKLVK